MSFYWAIWVSYPVVPYPSISHHLQMAKPSPKYSNDPALIALGNTLRNMRMSLGLSQEMMANNSNLDRSYMGGIERGEHNITLMNLIKIAEQLETRPSEILRDAGL